MISDRERWEIIGNSPVNGNHEIDEESSSLLNSLKDVREANQNARNANESMDNQTQRLKEASSQMKGVLQNINFVGNLARMIRTRSAEDNRLIAALSVGLVLEIIICLFVIKPIVRG